MDRFREDRNTAAHDFCNDHGECDGKADGKRIKQGILVAENETVDELEFGKANDTDGYGNQNGNAEFFPDDFSDIARTDLVESHAAYDGNGSLTAGISAGSHDHRYTGDEQSGEHGLITVQNETCKSCADHQNQKPGDSVQVDFKNVGVKVWFIGRSDRIDIGDIFGCFIRDDVQCIVDRDDSDEPVFLIHDRHREKVVFGK